MKCQYLWILVMVTLVIFTINVIYFPSHKRKEGFFACPNVDDSFESKRFVKTADCYSELGPNCMDVVRSLRGNYQVDGVQSQDMEVAIRTMMNNTYVNQSGEQFGVNECVISGSELENLGIKDCKLGDVQLRKNPASEGVSWTYGDGCVISEKQLVGGDFDKIVRLINKVYKDQGDKIQTDLSSGIQLNRKSTQQNWTEYKMNTKQAEEHNARLLEEQAKAYSAEERKKAEKAIEIVNTSITNIINLDIERRKALMNFLRDRIAGLRYQVYHGYFALNQPETLNHFKKYIPYECGFISKVNNFEGMRGYTNGTSTYRVSVDITGILRPDVSGLWSFALVSDDSAYMWIEETKDFENMDIPGAFLKNPGWHGDIRKEGSILLKGSDNDKDTKGYNIRIVHGNDGGPGSLRVYYKRPNSELWRILENDPEGTVNILYSPMKKGLQCKVTMGYFNDNRAWLNSVLPMCAVSIDEAYHLAPERWSPNYGITGKSKYFDFTRIEYTNFNKNTNTGVNMKTHPFREGYYPFEFGWQRSMNFYGWFIPPVAGVYTFYLTADDAAHLWIGDAAIDWVTAEPLINNGGVHGAIMKKTTFNIDTSMVGKTLPFRFVQGDWGGGNVLVFGYRKPGDLEVSYDLLEFFRH